MKKFYDMVDKYKDLILNAERYIWNNPEPGYREVNTTKYLAEKFTELGYNLVYPENCTGFYTVLDTGVDGPTVLVLAELDSLINFTHPECNKETGAVHSCGHHAQCAAILGLAAVLKEQGALDGLSGKIKLCLVPAEEGIEIGYRKMLVEKGYIKYYTGKPEFIRRRFFDDVDVAFMVHQSPNQKYKFLLTKGHNGNVRKRTTIKGVSAHAGAHPHNGVNALNAASLVLLAINSLRETFKEEDYIRVHSIITKGGDAVNAVPDEVVIESYVRAANSKVLKLANEKVNRAISAAAAAIGCGVEIADVPGSEPVIEDPNLAKLAFTVFEDIAGKDGYFYEDKWYASSTDMGDISSIVPAIHAYATGASGESHGINYAIKDAYNACVNSTKFQFGMIRKLLVDGAKQAKDIMAKFKPTFNSVEEYLQHKDSMDINKDTVIFNDDGTITLNYKG